MLNRKKITIFIPCYNEEENVLPAYKKIIEVSKINKSYDYEIIFIDNRSLDKTRIKIIQIAKKDKRVKGIFLSRNFGPESSGHAGLDHATGDAIIGIPADLQEPAELIPEFIKKWEKGYDIVLGIYKKTQDNILMKFIRKIF